MAPNPRRLRMRLQALYAQVPDIPACQGLCHDSCGPIEPSVGIAERHNLERASNRELGCVTMAGPRQGDCSMLTEDRRCSAYDDRPMICRLWGAVENMKCPFGCIPRGGWLPADTGMALLTEALTLAGLEPGQRDIAKDEIRALLDDPLARRKLLQAADELGTRPTVRGINPPLTVLYKDYRP